MHIYRLRCELLAPLTISKVFAAFENPYNLSLITPPWLKFQVVSDEPVVMRQGAEIRYRFHWLGLPLAWKTIITEYNPPFSFVDQQAQGPYPLWRHRHSFEATPNGTIVRDQVDYALPLGIFGRALHALVVGEQLRRIFAYRQAKMDELFGVRCLRLAPPEIVSP
jgi:ligand-binding SRPBCC domain-containing protein